LCNIASPKDAGETVSDLPIGLGGEQERAAESASVLYRGSYTYVFNGNVPDQQVRLSILPYCVTSFHRFPFAILTLADDSIDCRF
jgi:hypothetical protein